MNFETYDIHDATLKSITFDWAAATCKFLIHPVGRNPAELIFEGVSNLTIPHMQPWGPSRSINSANQCEPGKYEIEMQSGDTITILAKLFALTEH